MVWRKCLARLINYEKGKIEGRKIALIGGAGFIGHNLALHLHSLGAQVSIIDSLQVNNLASFSATSEDSVNRSLYLRILNERQRLLQEAQIPLFVQDARNYHALCRLISTFNPKSLFSLQPFPMQTNQTKILTVLLIIALGLWRTPSMPQGQNRALYLFFIQYGLRTFY